MRASEAWREVKAQQKALKSFVEWGGKTKTKNRIRTNGTAVAGVYAAGRLCVSAR